MPLSTIPRKFHAPVVKKISDGISAFKSYDWYFHWMQSYLANIEQLFLVPCAATKPIYTSPLHKSIYQKFSAIYGIGREALVVSEPVVLIRYPDLYKMINEFCYDYPPKLLSPESRAFFVHRLKTLLTGKNIVGCLPRHHATLINDAIGTNWENLWSGDMYHMIQKASSLTKPSH